MNKINKQKLIENATKLNLGCGYTKKEGYIGIDLHNISVADLYLDIGKEELPFKDNSITHIHSSHVFEHLNPSQFTFALKQIHRVLTPYGEAMILMPYATSISGDSEYHAFRPRYWVFKSFDAKFNTHEYEGVQFHIERTLIFKGKYKPFTFFNKIVSLYEKTCLRYLIPAQEIKLVLRVDHKHKVAMSISSSKKPNKKGTITVKFKSIPKMWEKEKNGLKPNTLRIIPNKEDLRFIALKNGEAKYIEMWNTETQEYFKREIIDYTEWGKQQAIISWRHQ